jgi:hypothetical protein
MSGFRLFMAQLRQAVRTPWIFFFVLLAAGGALGLGLSQQGQPPGRFLVGVVNEDQGEYGQRLLASLAAAGQLDLQPMAKSEALALLRLDRLEAAFVIRSDYTDKLRRSEYRDLIDWYTAPSSRAASAISEPLINGSMQLLLEEQAVAAIRDCLALNGMAFTDRDEQAQRTIIRQVWQNKTQVRVVSSTLAVGGAEKGDAAGPGSGTDAAPGGQGLLAACTRWYAVFIVFYLVVSASWVLDINRRSLRKRVRQSGTSLWLLLLANGLTPWLLALAGFTLTGALACLFSGEWPALFPQWLAMLVYLGSILGLMITLASCLRQTLALFFLAPLVTFVHALLSGLVAELPAWAGLLASWSRILPGRWLQTALDSGTASLPAALLCLGGWFLAGAAVSGVRQWMVDRPGGQA